MWRRLRARRIASRRQNVYGESAMKSLRKLRSRTAGPAWGLVFGVFMIAIGVGQGFYAAANHDPNPFDGSIAVAATLIGVFTAVYAAREIRRGKPR
jgi:uncharacterized membrane protein